ncbi:hypothetical protein BDZ91DRAFT_750266 [Kalaharituber pfeilii]|nr:hypothetical protein BDZ91DRAFT_750266 [Kalaharituber pfeilii]
MAGISQQRLGKNLWDPVVEENGDPRGGREAHQLGGGVPRGTDRTNTGQSETGREMVKVVRV